MEIAKVSTATWSHGEETDEDNEGTLVDTDVETKAGTVGGRILSGWTW